ncbi:hypothetical protein CR513_54138, partial [Mucuna pruriens]
MTTYDIIITYYTNLIILAHYTTVPTIPLHLPSQPRALHQLHKSRPLHLHKQLQHHKLLHQHKPLILLKVEKEG